MDFNDEIKTGSTEDFTEEIMSSSATANDNETAAPSEDIDLTPDVQDRSEQIAPRVYSGSSHAIQPEGKTKKQRLIQTPVIIALVIVLLAVAGYFTYIFFFLREPEGIVWSCEYEGVTYYCEFKEDGVFNMHVGSITLDSTYEKDVADGSKRLMIASYNTFFKYGEFAEYEITGSRLLKNQEMKITYDDETTFTLKQCDEVPNPLELPENFVPDEDLIGSWTNYYYGTEYCVVTFNDDGSASVNYVMNGVTYNGTYTLEDGTINFTFYTDDYIVEPNEYSIDGDILTFLKTKFIRNGSNATIDEYSISSVTETEAVEETQAASETAAAATE